MGGRKLVLGFSLVLLVTSLAPSVAADEGAGKAWRIFFDDAFMEEPVSDSVYNARADGTPFRLGDVPTAAQALRLRLCNDSPDHQALGVRMTLEPRDFGNTITRGIRAVVGGVLANTNITAAQTIASGACGNFEFGVNLTGVGTIGRHPLQFDLIFTRNALSDTVDNYPIDIWVSSLFDPVADLDNHQDLPRLMEATPGSNGLFFAARTYQRAGLGLVPAATVHDLRVNLQTPLPAGMAATGGTLFAYDPVATAGVAADLAWRIDLPGTPAPGLYDVAFNASYLRNPGTLTEVAVREEGLSTRTGVDFTPIVTAELTSPVTLARTNFSSFEVRFRNAGNVALRDLAARPAADGPISDFFLDPSGHYENAATTAPKPLALGNLAVGADTTQVVTVARPLYLPPGLHRLAFSWNAWIHDDGATESPGGAMWMRVGGQMVDDDGSTRTAEVGQLYRDVNENGRFDDGDGIIPGAWPGAYIEVRASEAPAPAILAATPALTTADVTNIALAVTLSNLERFGLVDAIASLRVGPGTPFLAPGDPTATLLPAARSPFSLSGLGGEVPTRTIHFTVDLNTAWWRSDSRPVGSHPAELLLDAINEDTATRLVGAVVPFRIELVGFGPNVLPSVVANGPIVGGQTFTLEVQLRNSGDDVARNIEVALTAPVRTVALLDGFFAAHRNVSLRLTDFGVGTYGDMVAAEALAERALSSPGGRVLVLALDRLAPGETRTVNFTLLADPSVIPGATYPELVAVKFSDSQAGRTITKGPFTFVLKGVDDRKIVIAAPGASGEGGFLSPGPGALAAVVVAALAGAFVPRGRRPR